jgi:hypothetical protein
VRVSAQSDDYGGSYFPLQVGNSFYYKTYNHDPGGTDTSFVVSRILSMKTYQGKSYYFCSNFLGTPDNYYIRYDSASGALLKYDSLGANCNNEAAFFKLSADLGDSLNTFCITLPNTKCIRISDTTVFGCNTRNKIFEYSFSNISGYYRKTEAHFDRDIGCLYFYSQTTSPHASFSQKHLMQGCLINGVLIGDTNNTFTNIVYDPVVPASYSLSQNYPNPFNPITNVKFSILKAEQVKLIVYDIRGREVQTLVNERLQPGTYETTFDGSMLPSGVYFYKLTSGDFSETKRMLMIK